MTDLTKLYMSETADLHLKHPVSNESLFNDEGAPMILTLHHAGSERFRSNKDDKILNVELAVSGWSGIQIGGQGVPFSLEALRDLYKNAPWIQVQVSRALVGFEAFLLDA